MPDTISGAFVRNLRLRFVGAHMSTLAQYGSDE